MASSLCLWAVVREAHAGRNAGAYADCSWKPDEVSSDRSLLPAGPFPLYVRLHGVASVRAIGIRIRWFPRSIGSQCYEVVDGPAGDSCGVLLDLPPNATPADTGYTGAIRFTSAPVDGDICIVAWLAHGGCTNLEPARFYVASLLVEDAEGGRDLLPIVSEVTILGGGEIKQPVALQSSGRMWLTPGFVNSFHIFGIGFDSTTTASLVGPGSTVAAAVSLDDSRSLSVTFDLPETFTGSAMLVLGNHSGPTDTLTLAISIHDTTAATGTGVNGSAHPMDRLASGGAWRKMPGDSIWTFMPAVPESTLAQGPGQVAMFLHALPPVPPARLAGPTPARTATTPARPLSTGQRPGPAPELNEYMYDRTVLFSDGFENDYLTNSYWNFPGVQGLPKWGRVTTDCARVLNGGWSISPVGSPGTGLPYCFGYSGTGATGSGWSDAAQSSSPYVSSYKAAELSFWRWIDTYSTQGSWDALYWYYSTDDGATYVPAGSANGLSGEDRIWRREMLTLDTGGGQVQRVKLLLRFLPTSGASFVALPNDSGVFVDDVSIAGIPYPNLTFWRPNQPGEDWASPLVVAAHPNATQDEPVTMGQTSYFRYGLTNNSYSRVDKPFHVSLWVADLGYIDDRTLGPWAPDQTWYSPNIPVPIPSNFCGQHEIRLSIDYNDDIREQNEGSQDNTYTRSLEWAQPAKADLRVTSAWASPSGACAGTPVTLHAVVQNAGTALAGSADLRYAVQSSAQDACGTGSSMGATRSLAPGATDTLEVVVNSSIPTTRWYEFAVDCINAVDEGCPQAEANNAYGPLGVTWLPAGADLAVTAFYAGRPPAGPLRPRPSSASTSDVDGTAPVGTSVPVTITVKNVGLAPTPLYWDLAWYRDLAHSPTAADLATLRYTIRKALAPGEDTTLAFPVTSAVATTWRMYALANQSGAVDECQRTANNVAGPSTLAWTTDSLVVRGRFTFRDTGYVRAGTRVALGAVHPLRGAQVEVWDKNKQTADRLLGTTCTGEDGAFALALPSRYDPERGPLEDAPQHVVDIYARAMLSADSVCAGIPAVTVSAWSDDSTWTYASPVHMDVLDAVLDLGEISPPLGEASYGHRSAMHIYDTILRGAQRMHDYGFEPFGAQTPSAWRVFVRWEPGVGDPSYPSSYSLDNKIWLVGAKFHLNNLLTPDEWDDYVLLHEYGHQLARMGGFSYTPPTSSACRHATGQPVECPAGTPNPGLAWEEGWAMFIGAMLDSAGPDSVVFDRGYDGNGSLVYRRHGIERGTEELGGELAIIGENVGHSGPAYQEANAGALWDWVDGVDDDEDPYPCSDHFSDGFERVVGTLLTESPLGIDSLVNLYMAYQHREIGADLPRARALFEVLCDHGWWRVGAGSDTVHFVGADPARLGPPHLTLNPTPTRGPVLISVSGLAGSPPSIEVFDLAGRVLWGATALRIGNGRWQLAWDGRTSAGEGARPGIYFVRCRAGGGTLRHTLVIVR
jgi:hypothetical protein